MKTTKQKPQRGLDPPRMYARYKNRNPDPGLCQIVSINWEERQLSMIGGYCRYFPSFDEIEIVSANDLTLQQRMA